MANSGLAQDSGHGITVVFATTGFTATLLSVDVDGISRAAHDTSHLGLAATAAGTWGNMTFLPSDLVDPGTITLNCHANTSQDAAHRPPIGGTYVMETITLTWPLKAGGAAAATWVGTGFCTESSVNFNESPVVYSIKFKLSAIVTPTAAT